MDLPPDPPKLGHSRSWIDLVVAFSVIFISLVSLFIALRQSSVMEKQLSASVWPFLQFDNSNYDPERQEAAIFLAIQNVGVGPARIVALNLSYEGKSADGWKQLVDSCCNPDGHALPNMLSSGVVGHVLPANGKSLLFDLKRSPEDEAVWNALNVARHKIEGSVCYCSVLSQCYVSDIDGSEATPVADCDALKKRVQFVQQ